MKKKSILIFVILLVMLSACAHYTPSRPNNVCHIFQEKPSWKKAALKSQRKWGGSTSVAMSIIFQESSFKAKAKPSMEYFLWVIPAGRPSSAYGYSQALKSTWREYQTAVGSNSKQRDNFADSIDFVHWYMHKSANKNAVQASDAFSHYLNYHEGHGGYARQTYRQKSWLLQTARKVAQRASRYQQQLRDCR